MEMYAFCSKINNNASYLDYFFVRGNIFHEDP